MSRVLALLLLLTPCATACNNRSAPLLVQVSADPPPPALAEPSASNPVTAVAWLTPRDLAPGQSAELRVRLHISPGHHLYAATSPDASGVPVSLQLKPSDALIPATDWTPPRPDGNNHLTGVVEYSRPVRVTTSAAPGPHAITCDLTCQACTSELCWPPRTLTLTAELVVKPEPPR